MYKFLFLLIMSAYNLDVHAQSKDTIPPDNLVEEEKETTTTEPIIETVVENAEYKNLRSSIPKFLGLAEDRLKGKCKKYLDDDSSKLDFEEMYKQYSELDKKYSNEKNNCKDKHHPKLVCVFKDHAIQTVLLEEIVRNNEFASFISKEYSDLKGSEVKEFYETLISQINLNAN